MAYVLRAPVSKVAKTSSAACLCVCVCTCSVLAVIPVTYFHVATSDMRGSVVIALCPRTGTVVPAVASE